MKRTPRRIAQFGLIFLFGITFADRVSYGERALDLPAGSPGYIYNSFRDAKKIRLTYAGSYSVRVVDRQREVQAILVVDMVKNGEAYSIGDSRLFLDGKLADAASVRGHLAMLALDNAKSRSSSSLTLNKSNITNLSNVAQAVNYAGMDKRCSIEIHGTDYLAMKLKTGSTTINYEGRAYQCLECYYYKRYHNGSSLSESAYYHDAIPGRIGRFFRNYQNTETQSKSEAESEEFDFKLNKIESIP